MSARRSARFPCGDCSKSCSSTNCISCGMCQRWFHTKCEKITIDDFETWSSLAMDYLCRSCRSVSGDGSDFDYMMGMHRLSKASETGLAELTKAAKREHLFLKDVKLQTTVQSDFKHHQQDRTANTLATYFYATDKVALKSTPDGNCFFNAVSTLLTGDELRSTELRYRCCVEMTLNRSKIQAHPQFKRLTVLCPPYDDDCLHCAKPGTDSSMHMFIAMSQLLNLPIQVVYPAVNGSSHYNFKVSNTLLRPPFSDPDNGQLTLMWSTMRVPSHPPSSSAPWRPNHIVPLVDGLSRGPLTSMSGYYRQKDEMEQSFTDSQPHPISLQEEEYTVPNSPEDPPLAWQIPKRRRLSSSSSYINEELQTNNRFEVFSDSDTTSDNEGSEDNESDNEDSEDNDDTPDYCNEPSVEIKYNKSEIPLTETVDPIKKPLKSGHFLTSDQFMKALEKTIFTLKLIMVTIVLRGHILSMTVGSGNVEPPLTNILWFLIRI